MLGDRDLSKLGFDTSIYWENGRRYVNVMGQAPGARRVGLRKYEIESVLSQRQELVDHGTTCWMVKEVGGDESVLMKDIWRDEGQKEEDFLVHAKKGEIVGVRKLLFVDKSWTKKPLSISALRLDQGIPVASRKERIFSRLILELQGPSIRHFDSGLQLLQGLRDAVLGTFPRC